MMHRNNNKYMSLFMAAFLTAGIAVNGFAAETDFSFMEEYSKEQLLEADRVIHRKLNNIAGNTVTAEQPIVVEKCAVIEDDGYNFLEVKIRNASGMDMAGGVSLSFQILDEQGDSLEDKSIWYDRADAGQGVTERLWIEGNLSTPKDEIAGIKIYKVYIKDTGDTTSFEVPYVFDGSGNDMVEAEAGEEETEYETLSVGSKNDAVTKMQEVLFEKGFLDEEPDGEFGNVTKGAVIRFQEYAGLEATGEADSKTLETLYGE